HATLSVIGALRMHLKVHTRDTRPTLWNLADAAAPPVVIRLPSCQSIVKTTLPPGPTDRGEAANLQLYATVSWPNEMDIQGAVAPLDEMNAQTTDALRGSRWSSTL